MKQPQEVAQDIGLDEQNYLLKAIKDLKDSIFNVLYVLLDKDEDEQQQESMFGLIFESGLDYFQMLAFPFDQSIMEAWNGGETLNNISGIFSKLNIMSYLPGVSFNTFLAMLYGLIFLIILVLIDIIYVSYSFSKKRFRFTWPLVILAKLVPLFVTIFFLPITQTLLSVVRCGQVGQNSNGEQVMLSFPDVTCWKGMHLFHASITFLFTSLFVFISSIVASALFQPRMVSKKLTARQNSTGQVIFIMNKIICQLIFSFNPFKQKWMYSLILFGLSGLLYWTYNIKDPFYNKKASKFFRIVSSYYFWTNTMLLVSQLLSPLGFNGGLVIWISGLPFIGIIIGFEHKSNIDQLFSFNLKFKSGEQLEGHLRYVLQLLQSQQADKNSYMLVTGYIQKHKEICIEDDCPLKVTKKLNKTLSEKEDLNEKFLLQIERMYKLGIKKYPNCTRLRLSYAFFQMEWLKNKNKAYQQFSYALKTDPSFEQQFIVYRFKKIIRQNLQGSQGEQNKTDLIQIIRFENHISLCEQAMISSARLHKDFWTEMKQQSPDLRKLNAIGNKITKTVNVVKQNYEQISKINGSVPQVLYCFSIFLILVVKDNIQGKKLLQMAKKIYLEKVNVSNKKTKHDQNEDNIEQLNDQPLITVSCKSDSIGKVLNLNSLFTQLCGYQRQQIVQRSFQKILPQLLKDVHEQRIKQWIQSQQQSPSNYMNKTRQGYIKTKSGFILPVQYQVIYKPSTQCFIIIFKNSTQYRNYCHINVDINLIIRDISTLGHVYFKLDRWVLSQNQINLKEFFGIQKFYQIFSQKKGSDVFEEEIVWGGSTVKCMMNVEEISMSYREKLASVQDSKGQQIQSKRILGYYLRILPKNLQKQQPQSLQPVSPPHEQSEDELYSCSQNQNQILQLYEDPNIYDILLTNLAEAKTKTTQIQKFKLTSKIKTMRLLNNEIKMVYDQNNNYDFDNIDHDEDQDDDLQIMKLNDDRYQEKIRTAINTKLRHQQVNRLKYVGFGVGIGLVLIALGEMLFGVGLLNQFQTRAQQFQQLVIQTNQLSKYISSTLFPQQNYSSLSTSLQSHNINLNLNRTISIKINQNIQQQLTLKDAYLYLYSKIGQFYTINGNINIDNVYSNFISHVFNVVESVQFRENQGLRMVRILILVCLLAAGGISLGFLAVWIYTRVEIDKKKSDILLWFLDIPIPYASYLGDHCDNYLKNFVSVKEVMNKGIKMEQYHDLQDYKDLKGKQQQMQEQQKARKTLILKQRKLTFWSRLNCSHFKLLWVLVFGLISPLVVVIQSTTLQNYETFLKEQWAFSGKTVLWINSIQLSYLLQNANKYSLNDVDISQFRRSVGKKLISSLTQPKLNAFNSQILLKSSIPQYKQIFSSYINLYFQDLCAFLQQQNPQCESISQSTLDSGLRIFISHLSSHGDNIQYDHLVQLKRANQLYVSVGIIKMLGIWKSNMEREVEKAVSIVELLFYIYVFAGILCFFVAWLIYLGKLNDQINEAIKMLNMIPFKLLSSSRKETRSFIAWIIREANKKKHQIQ